MPATDHSLKFAYVGLGEMGGPMVRTQPSLPSTCIKFDQACFLGAKSTELAGKERPPKSAFGVESVECQSSQA